MTGTPPQRPGAGGSGITARGATGVGVASIVAAASGMLILLVAAKVLSLADNADFFAFWGLLFFFFGTLGGLQSEVTRSVHVERTQHVEHTQGPAPDAPGPSGARILPFGLVVGGVLAGVIALSSPLWATAVLGPAPQLLVAVVAVAVLAFAGHSTVAGALAGRGLWVGYSRLVGAEATVRLLLVLGVAVVGATSSGLAVATAAAAGTWLLLSLVPQVRSTWHQRADVDGRRFLAASATAMVGAASSAALVVGFPVLLRVSTPPDVYELAAPVLFAITLTRAPLLIPLNAYQGVAITHFLNHRDQGARPLVRLASIIGAAGVVAAAAAALVGPWLMALIRPEYRVEPLVLGALTLTAAVLALLTLTGAATLALGRHRAYAAGWLVATVCSTAVLLLPGALEGRVIASLGAGPLVGVLVHVAAVRRALRADRPGTLRARQPRTRR